MQAAWRAWYWPCSPGPRACQADELGEERRTDGHDKHNGGLPSSVKKAVMARDGLSSEQLLVDQGSGCAEKGEEEPLAQRKV